MHEPSQLQATSNQASATATTLLSLTLLAAPLLAPLSTVAHAAATDQGASSLSNSKIATGGASTLQSGRTISITRGVNLDNSDFSNRNLKGVAFQQSIVRDADFSNSNLYGASFFDATVDGSNFENSDMTLCNIEMAQFNRANLKVSNTCTRILVHLIHLKHFFPCHVPCKECRYARDVCRGVNSL